MASSWRQGWVSTLLLPDQAVMPQLLSQNCKDRDDSTQRVFVLNNEGTVSVFNARVGGTTSPQ
jgi:hypothetical protein